MKDALWLKWGTLKAWNFQSEEARAAARAYAAAGDFSAGAMQQRDNEAQKKALCDLIDAVNCDTIGNDWSGEQMTKDQAKAYVMEYGR